MILSAIAAMAENRVIGKNGVLPWRIPEDFKFFKDKTMGHIMVMGRKTFESLGGALPGRLHVVITRQSGYKPSDAIVVGSIDEAITICQQILTGSLNHPLARKADGQQWPEEVFIVGGGEIYREMLPVTDRIYLTEIQQTFEGDAKFPEFSDRDFTETERSHREKPVPFDFVTYERRP
ncbi:MAG TPA: dihydrofolate reductase [Bdellovibrionales bacterium]|nr:dihydrofolate reductase [Bdellovibrionales bacterium]